MNSSFQVSSGERQPVAEMEISDSDGDEPQAKQPKKHSKKKKKKKEHKHHKEKPLKPEASAEPKSEFTGKENYYVDKKPCNNYIALETLKRDDSARYHVHFYYLGKLTAEQWRILRRRSKDRSKRYFTKFKTDKANTAEENAEPDQNTSKTHRLSEEDFTAKTKVLNKELISHCNDIDLWLELVRFQEHFYMKMTKMQLAERKMEILNKALRDNPKNDKLYREYVDILEKTYPSFEVSKFLDILIQKGKNACIFHSLSI